MMTRTLRMIAVVTVLGIQPSTVAPRPYGDQASPPVQESDDASLRAAIKAGEDRTFKNLLSTCTAGAGYRDKVRANARGGTQPVGAFSITVSTNAGRVALLAAEAKRQNQPFGLADVPQNLRLSAVYVLVEPKEPVSGGNGLNSTTWVPAAVDTVLLKSSSQPDEVVQPETVAAEAVSFKVLRNDFAYVGTLERVRALASYSMQGVKRLPAGDLQVVVVTRSGERSCQIGAGDRKHLY